MLLTEDPFRKPSLTREVGVIEYNERPLTLNLPGLLPADYTLTPLADSRSQAPVKAVGGKVEVRPGVYLLSDGAPELDKWPATAMLGNIRLDEFVAPAPSEYPDVRLAHKPPFGPRSRGSVTLTADVAGGEGVDSVMIYPGDISFWRDRNTLYPMTKTAAPYRYEGEMPLPAHGNDARYWLVAWRSGKPYTFPGGHPGTPLDWDFPDDSPAYDVEIADYADPGRAHRSRHGRPSGVRLRARRPGSLAKDHPRRLLRLGAPRHRFHSRPRRRPRRDTLLHRRHGPRLVRASRRAEHNPRHHAARRADHRDRPGRRRRSLIHRPCGRVRPSPRPRRHLYSHSARQVPAPLRHLGCCPQPTPLS